MSSIGIRHLPAARRPAHRPPPGFGLAIGAVVSLALWASLLVGALALFGG